MDESTKIQVVEMDEHDKKDDIVKLAIINPNKNKFHIIKFDFPKIA
jgi:hypothetical protein